MEYLPLQEENIIVWNGLFLCLMYIYVFFIRDCVIDRQYYLEF